MPLVSWSVTVLCSEIFWLHVSARVYALGGGERSFFKSYVSSFI